MSKKEIVICNRCKGLGSDYGQKLIDHHKGDYINTSKQCTRCNGRGMLLKTTTIEFKIIVTEDMDKLGYNYQEFGYSG